MPAYRQSATNSMTAGNTFFVDTNVLLYERDQRKPAKRRAAHDWLGVLWEREAGRVSWQVLNEYYANAPAPVARRTV